MISPVPAFRRLPPARLSRRLLLASLLVVGPVPLSAQSTNPIVSAVVSTDSIRVGELFVLDLHVDLPAAAEVRFPAVLPLPENVEQREAVEIESRAGGTIWQARYTLSAWTTDTLAIPPVLASVLVEGGEPFEISIEAPREAVRSVLPADGSDLALRDARPFLRVRGFPWWILLVAAALAFGAWRLLRRTRPELAFVPSGPGDRALHDFDQLREQWQAGTLSVGQFYDGYERALRRYARATRSWAPYRSLAGLVGSGDLFTALRRSLFVRFAHVLPRTGGPEEALDAGESFIRSEMPAPDEEDSIDQGPRPAEPAAPMEAAT